MRLIRQIISWPLDFALPRRCAGCGGIQPFIGDFCASCWLQLDQITGAGCLRCATPIQEAGLICATCLAHPPDHDGVLAAVDYGPIARRLVLRLKYGRKPQFAHVMARLMARHAAAYPDALLIPVPLHWTRLWQRGFNQSLLIARCVASHTGQLVHPQALVRTRRTRPLGRLSQKDRAIEVRGVFRLANGFSRLVQGRDILLVDDVYTSGATANACAKLLKRNGAQSVRILCWARVVIDAP